jgi:hypothetical protein
VGGRLSVRSVARTRTNASGPGHPTGVHPCARRIVTNPHGKLLTHLHTERRSIECPMPEAAEHDVSHAVIAAEKSDYEHIRRLLTPHLASCITRHGPLHVTGALRDTEALRVTARYG